MGFTIKNARQRYKYNPVIFGATFISDKSKTLNSREDISKRYICPLLKVYILLIMRTMFQSVVILSRLPFSILFQKLSSLIAPDFFEKGSLSLEAACHSINRWQPPVPGQILSLPILGTVFRVSIPTHTSNVTNGNINNIEMAMNTAENPLLQVSIADNNLFETVLPVLSHISLLWELVLTAEPLVVMAPSPTNCSALVVALTRYNLILLSMLIFLIYSV